MPRMAPQLPCLRVQRNLCSWCSQGHPVRGKVREVGRPCPWEAADLWWCEIFELLSAKCKTPRHSKAARPRSGTSLQSGNFSSICQVAGASATQQGHASLCPGRVVPAWARAACGGGLMCPNVQPSISKVRGHWPNEVHGSFGLPFVACHNPSPQAITEICCQHRLPELSVLSGLSLNPALKVALSKR